MLTAMRLPLLLLLAGCPPGAPDSGDDTDVDVVDADADGVGEADDCDDADPLVYPGAAEICDGKDSDCTNGPAFGEGDVDSDGLLDCGRCDTAGFWQATKFLDQPADIRTALDGVIKPVGCTYAQSTDYMFIHLDNYDFEVECVYTGRKTTAVGDKPDPNDMNTEHSWPQSQGADVEPAKCDLHHLYPTDTDANNARASWPFDEVVSGVSWSEGGSSLGKNAAGATVFEPRDVHKGNVARSMLYFAWRYDKTLSAAQIARFQEWNLADPVDTKEWDRTVEIGVRDGDENPFVACPDLADRAW